MYNEEIREVYTIYPIEKEDTIQSAKRILKADPDYYSFLIKGISMPLRLKMVLSYNLFKETYRVDPRLAIGEVMILSWEDTNEEFYYDYDPPSSLRLEFPIKNIYNSEFSIKTFNDFLNRAKYMLYAGEERCILPIQLYPCFRALLVEEEIVYEQLEEDTEQMLLAAFSVVKEHDQLRKTFLQNGKKISLPKSIEPPKPHNVRLVFCQDPPMISPFSSLKQVNHINNVSILDPLLASLISHIAKTPIPANFIRYGDFPTMEVAPLDLRVSPLTSSTIKYTKKWNVTKFNKGPVTVNLTPLEQALKMLVKVHETAKSQYCVPVYITNVDHKYYHKYMHEYIRRDGKRLELVFALKNSEETKPKHCYVSIPDLVIMTQEYISFCSSKYFEAVVEQSFRTGVRDIFKSTFMNMLFNNPLIVNLLESTHYSRLHLSIYSIPVNYSLLEILPAYNSYKCKAVDMVLKAPLKYSSFVEWFKKNNWSKNLKRIDITTIRINEYGLCSPLTFGVFEHNLMEHLKLYINKASVFPPGERIPVSKELVVVLGDILMALFDSPTTKVVVETKNSLEYNWALTHIYRQALVSGISPGRFTITKHVFVCASCYTNLRAKNFISDCCLVNTKIKPFISELLRFEAIFNYWLQKILFMNSPTLNMFMYYCKYSTYFDNIVQRCFRIIPQQGTMLSIFDTVRKGNIAVSEINDQLTETRKILNEVNHADLVNRANNLVTKFESILPETSTSIGITGVLDIMDLYVQEKIYNFVKMIFPLYDKNFMPTISLSGIIKDYILLRSVDNVVIKGFILIDLLSKAGLIDTFRKFFEGFSIITKEQNVTAWSDLSEWLEHFFQKPVEWIKHVGGFISGFVMMMVDSTKQIDLKHLLNYITKIAPAFRSFASIGSGITAIGTIVAFVSKAYYLAKEYVYSLFGKKCEVPLYVHLTKHLTNWSAAVSTLIEPIYRNTIINSTEVWPIIDSLSDVGLKLLAESKNNALNSTMAHLLKELMKVRSQVSLVRGIPQDVFVPFVVHLNGPAKIGKSAMVGRIIYALSKTMNISDRTYQYNETLKFMDGYSGQEILVCDDVNLCKTAENNIWLIKAVSPNMCFLPTAINEERPMISNIKVIILTSNTLYTPIVDVATTTGIDRRSEYKFTVNSDYYDSTKTCMDTGRDGFSWDEAHIFKRVSSVRDQEVTAIDKFEGKTTPFIEYLCREALRHTEREKLRLSKKPVGYFPLLTTDSIKMTLLDSISAGSEPIDLTALRETISTIKLVTPETFLNSGTTLVPNDELLIQNITLQAMSLSHQQAESVVHREANEIRLLNSFLRFSNGIIYFDGPRQTADRTTIIDTEPLYGRPFEYKGLKLDFYFLHHLEYNSEGFHINKYFKRNNFVSKNISELPLTSLLDYHSMESLITDNSFINSWSIFFSQPEAVRFDIFHKYKMRIQTTQFLTRHKVTWSERLSKLFTRIFSKNAVNVMLVSSYIGLITIAAVGATYEALRSMLYYNAEKEYFEGLTQVATSNVGKSTKETKRSGVNHKLTVLRPDQCYEDVKEKVIKNLYLARLVSYLDKPGPIMNILFVGERFALINHHALKGFNPKYEDFEKNKVCIDIYVPKHQNWVRYTFDRKYYHFRDQDLLMLKISNFQAQSSIVSLFMENDVDPSCYGSPIEVVYHTNAKRGIAYETNHGKLKQLNDTLIVTNSTETPETYSDAYCLDVILPHGSSGGVVFLDDRKYQTKVIGIQSSSGWLDSHAVRVTQRQIREAFEYYNQKSMIKIPVQGGVVCCDTAYEEVIDRNVPSKIGIVPKEKGVTISNKTCLKKTPWFDQLIERPLKTPVLSRVSLEDRYIYLNKTERTLLLPFNQMELDKTVFEYSNYLKDIIKEEFGVKSTTILSLDQVLNGTYRGGKPIDLSTSPGIGIGDWIHTRTKPGQHDFAIREQDHVIATPKLTRCVQELLSDLMSGNAGTSTYASFPKDELRNKDARGIDGSPIEQKEVYKMLFGSLDGMLSKANRGQLRYGLGIDLFSPSGTNLISRMAPEVMMWDFSNYDGSITYQLYEAVTNVYNHLSDNDEFSIARHTLSYKTCFSTIIADQGVYQPLKGMRSGFGGTSSFNTHIHNILLIVAIKQLIAEHVEQPTIYDVFEIVDWITYGDDGLAWLKRPEYSSIINGKTISEKFIEFGLIVTDPRGKTDLPPESVDITEASFLKHSPYFDKNLNVPLWRVGEECLQSVFSYYSGDDPYEPLDCAFRMLWPYGRERYEQYRTKLNRILDKNKREYTIDWLQFLDIFLLKFSGTSYTGKSFIKSVSEENHFLD